MNHDEEIVFEYLIKHHGSENVIFEPNPNSAPDIVINSCIAVEVRRLNQHFFAPQGPEGLENLQHSLFAAFTDILKSFDTLFRGNTYWVSIEYERPLSLSIRQVKKGMKLALCNFIASDISNFPIEIPVNSEIAFWIDRSNPINGRVFRAGGSVDSDAGGWVIQNYLDNIRYCIKIKSSKILNQISQYSLWWLYLVDHMGWGLDSEEVQELISFIDDIGSFNKVVILSADGNNVMAVESK